MSSSLFFILVFFPFSLAGPRLPDKVIGMYLNLADDEVFGYGDLDDWDPLLYPYQQEGANVLYFSFINPATMVVPHSFRNLAQTRGTGVEGAIPADTKIIFAVGGYQYSQATNPWRWLATKEDAEEMAYRVSQQWTYYGADGIDLDLESGAGDRPEAGINMYFFIQKLRSYVPDFIITQPTFGFPQITANNFIINNSWDVDGISKNVADTVGIMAYGETTGIETESLDYVKNYAEATSQWNGFPIRVNVPRDSILVGCKGSAAADNIMILAESVVDQDLLGIMVWYCSVKNGFEYEPDWDGSNSMESQEAFKDALNIITQS